MTKIRRHVRDYFRAISQSFFFCNAYFGFLLLAILAAFDPKLFAYGASASLICYLASIRSTTPRILRDGGLITINGFFFGIAMASLFRSSPVVYACLVLGAMAVPAITKASFDVLQHWKVSPLVISYIVAVWIVWLCARSTGLYIENQVWSGSIPFFPEIRSEGPLFAKLLWSAFESIGRLLFLPNPLFGAWCLVAVAAFSPRRGFYFLLGTLVGTFAAYLMTRESTAWEHGMLSYCAGLIGLGLASFPQKLRFDTILFYCILSSFLTLAASQFLAPLNLPVLSLPYVLTLWLAILSRVPRMNVSWGQVKPVCPQAVEAREVEVSVQQEGGKRAA